MWRTTPLVGWQTGVFQCRPRDRWLGWHKAVQFRRLHLIANNTRFLVLPEGAGVQHLASRVLAVESAAAEPGLATALGASH